MKKITDKIRLDWLSRKETAFYKTVDGVQFEQAGFRCGSLRRAIDAALKAEKKSPRASGKEEG